LDTHEGKSLLGVRLIDWRWRFDSPLTLTAFFGAARYALATPAYGEYIGGGLQWRDLFKHIDASIEYRYYDDIARDRVLASDVQSSNRPDSFYTISGVVFSLNYHF